VLHATAAEICPLPKADARLVRRYRNDVWRFLTECFPRTLGLPPLSDDHNKRFMVILEDWKLGPAEKIKQLNEKWEQSENREPKLRLRRC
jgi:hypothetical protein